VTTPLPREGETGAVALEMALIAPLLILLTFGIIEFGLWIFNSAQASQSAREAARVAMVDPPPPGMISSGPVYDAATRGVWADVVAVTAACSSVSCDYGGTVTVTVGWTHSFLTPIAFAVAGSSSVAVSGESTRQIVG
jgi:Flp pilus assembly protein TadG